MPAPTVKACEFLFNGRSITVKPVKVWEEDGLTHIKGYRWQYFKNAWSNKVAKFVTANPKWVDWKEW